MVCVTWKNRSPATRFFHIVTHHPPAIFLPFEVTFFNKYQLLYHLCIHYVWVNHLLSFLTVGSGVSCIREQRHLIKTDENFIFNLTVQQHNNKILGNILGCHYTLFFCKHHPCKHRQAPKIKHHLSTIPSLDVIFTI